MPNLPEMFQHLSASASQWSVPLAVAWAGWMAVGLALSFWWKRQTDAVVAPAYVANWDATPSQSVRPRTNVSSNITPAVVKPQQPKGDAFSELQAMLDKPGNEDVTN